MNSSTILSLAIIAFAGIGGRRNGAVLPSALRRVKKWSLRTFREKLITIGAKVVKHSRYLVFQMAEVTVLRVLCCEILDPEGQPMTSGSRMTGNIAKTRSTQEKPPVEVRRNSAEC